MIDPNDITIQFPCAYRIHVIGERSDTFVREVVAVVRKHDTSLTPDAVSLRQSKKGRYESVRITITATGEAQLKAMHTALMEIDEVKMVL